MKAIIVLLSLSAAPVFAQENPWAPKGENPWKNYQGNEEIVQPVVSNQTAADSLLVSNDPTDSTKQAVDAYRVQPLAVKTIETPLNNGTLSDSELYALARRDAVQSYRSGGDFAFGLAMGMLFNVFSFVIADPIYISATFERETEVMKAVESKKIYEPADDQLLHRKVKNEVKGKKAASTIIGSVLGTCVQVAVLRYIF